MEHLLDFFTPKNYQLELYIDKQTEVLKGSVIITGEPHADTIKFHAVDMTIDEVKINDQPCDWTCNNNLIEIVTENVSSRDRSEPAGEKERRSPVKTGRADACPERNISVAINYHRSLSHNMQGCYVSTYKHNNKTEKIVSTQFESHYARECFPCIDEPAAKATFDVSISLPENSDDTVLFNTEILEQNENSFQFEQTPKMSTYLLAFVIGNFHHKSITNKHGIKITSYCALNQSPDTLDHANQIAADSLDYYDEKFKIPYPLKKLDQVAIPDFEAGAMENWGLVTYRESCMLASEDSALSDKQYIATVIAHELSHQWFGNLVTMRWWDDLWLNESFANVIEFFATDAIRPEYNIWEEFFTHDCFSALKRDSLKGVQSVHQPVNNPAEIATLFDGAIVYNKGAHLMFMLIRLIGEDKFFEGIRDYFEKHQYSNTTGDDLWAALQPYADFNVKEFMSAWISQSGYPVITDEEQKRFLIDGSTDDTKWPLPKIKDDMSGHYLINLSDEEFSQKLQNFDNLSLEQKLRLLLDHYFLAQTPMVSSASLLDLLPYFKNETSYAVWSIIIRIINHIKLFCPPKSEAKKAYKKYLQDIISVQLNRLGVVPKPNEPDNDTKLRAIILGLAHYTKEQKTLEQLRNLYDPDFTKINSEIRGDVLYAKIHFDEDEIFNDLLNKYQTEPDPNIKAEVLSSLTNAKNPEHIKILIDLLQKTDIVRPQDHLYLYVYLRANHHTKPQAFDWVINNWQFIEKLAGDKSIEDYPRYTANTIRDKEEAQKFHDFFDPIKNQPALTRAVEVADGEIKARLELIDSDTPAVHKKLGIND